MRLLGENCNPDNLSPLTLAFVGDGVYELFERVSCLPCQPPAGELNSRKVQMVRRRLRPRPFGKFPIASPKRSLRFSSGAETPTPPHSAKNASSADYHAATGLEALFGWLYLSDMKDRAAELLK